MDNLLVWFVCDQGCLNMLALSSPPSVLQLQCRWTLEALSHCNWQEVKGNGQCLDITFQGRCRQISPTLMASVSASLPRHQIPRPAHVQIC